MKTLIPLFLLLFMSGNLKAQDNLEKLSLADLEKAYQEKIDAGQYQEAEPYVLAMLQKGEKELATQDTAYAKILYHVANVKEYLGAIDEAMAHLEKAINIQKIKISQHPDYAKSIHLLGILYRNKGDYAQAEKFYTQAMNIRKTALGENHKDYASSLNNLGNLYYDLGDYARAEQFHLQALEIRKNILGEKHPEYAKNLGNLGVLYCYMGDYEKAETYCQNALNIQKQVLGEKHTDYAASLNNLGLIFDYRGDYNQSKKFYLQALKIQKEALGETHPDYATSLDNIGIFYRRIGDFAEAEKAYFQVLSIQKKAVGEMHPSYAQTLNNLGSLYTDLGDYGKVEFYLLEALKIKKETLGEKHPEYAMILNNLGLLQYSLKEYVQAENFYLQAAGIEKEALGEKHPDYAKTLNNLGTLYHETKDYAKAETYYQQAIGVEKEALGEMHLDYAKSLNNLAILYSDLGKYAQAEGFYLKVLEIRKKVLGEKHPDYAAILNNLGTLNSSLGDYKKAEAYFSQALNILKESLGEKHPEYTAALNNLATLMADKKQPDLAWKYVLAAIYSNADLAVGANISKEWKDSLLSATYISLDNINRSLIIIHQLSSSPEKELIVCDLALELLKRNKNELSDDKDKLRILSQSNEWVQKSMKIVSKTDMAKAFDIAEQNKSVLLLDATSNKRVYTMGLLPDSLAQKEVDLLKKYSNLEAALIQERSETNRAELRAALIDLNLQIEIFQKQIKKDYPKYAALKYQYETIKVQEIQSILADNTVLLEYLVADSSVYIFYVDKKQIKVHELAISNKDLNEKIHAFHDALSNYKLITTDATTAYRQYTYDAYWFYKNLILNNLGEAKDINQLIIIPDGELGHLPFEVFLTKQAPQKRTDYKELNYLIQEYSISYNYSASLLKESLAKNKKTNNAQILAVASNYEISLNPAKNSLRLPTNMRIRAGLNPLPAARKEVEVLSENFQGFFALDHDATEKFFKENAPKYAVIHLAMHGLLNKNEQMLSSLAFTEDGDSVENNFLHAFEISKMDLNADLVVLSACETGIGKFERGNGIASLSRAFMYAGVSSLVVSLWQVNDYSTSIIMQSFYTNLSKGMTKNEALQQAKMEYMKNAKDFLAHPAFWSPFILMGNTEAITLSSKSGSWLWLLGIGGVLVLGLGVWQWHRKE